MEEKLTPKFQRVDKFDITVYGYIDYQDRIRRLYPNQYLDLHWDQTNEEVWLKAHGEAVGKLFSEAAQDLIPYLEEPEKYFVEAYVKKFYYKEGLDKAIVVVIHVYEINEGFEPPHRPFLGDYVSNANMYVWGSHMDDAYPFRCPVRKLDEWNHVVEKLEEGEDVLFVRNEKTSLVDVYSDLGEKFGELSPKNSNSIIHFFRDPDRVIQGFISKVSQRDSGKWSCTLEIDVMEKKRKAQRQHLQTEQATKPAPKRGCTEKFLIAVGVVVAAYTILWLLVNVITGSL